MGSGPSPTTIEGDAMKAAAILTTPALLLALAGCHSFPTPETPLMAAAHEGRADVIQTLLKEGARPDERDAHKWTALDWAARGGHPLRPHRCGPQLPEHIQAIHALLAGGASINAINENGWTALIIAIHHRQAGAALALMDAGADVGIAT